VEIRGNRVNDADNNDYTSATGLFNLDMRSVFVQIRLERKVSPFRCENKDIEVDAINTKRTYEVGAAQVYPAASPSTYTLQREIVLGLRS